MKLLTLEQASRQAQIKKHILIRFLRAGQINGCFYYREQNKTRGVYYIPEQKFKKWLEK